MTVSNASRREFLRQSAWLSAACGTAAPFAMNLATMNAAVAQTAGYKALVCIFLSGGNDAANTVLPTDTASWTTYMNTRNQGVDPIALLPVGTPQNLGARPASPAWFGGVLPIGSGSNPANAGRELALHPAMRSLQTLYQAGKVAVVNGLGTLVEPITKTEYQRNLKAKPPRLYSHADQQTYFQALATEAQVGWGGRMADLLASMNGSSAFASVSTSGNAVWLAGQQTIPFQSGGAGIGGLTGTMFGSNTAAASFNAQITSSNRSNVLEKDINRLHARAISLQQTITTAVDQVKTAGTVAEPPRIQLPSAPNTTLDNPLSVRLRDVARIIAARGSLGIQRQVFFVTLGGSFDTHDGQNARQGDNLAILSDALAYFDQVLTAMGMADSVTTFTASDFGRTFTTNGDGTDHGWAGHHFVLGGAVKGDIYGRYPQMGVDSTPDTIGSGIVIPSISVEQYGATLGRWFGLNDTGLNTVFPNLRNFAQRDLGFMA